MADPLQGLKQLVYLAHEHSDDQSRRELLRRVTDVFLQAPGAFTARQNAYFGDIMARLAYDLEQRMREELARRIAAEAAAPPELVRRLAHDEIAVAQPVLERSPALTQDDLIGISAGGSQAHLLAITKRADIQARLSAVLVQRGQDHVIESLVRNRTAEIAAETIARVAERAQSSEGLQSALVTRADVPREIMAGMLEHVSEKLRHTILDKLSDADRASLDAIVGEMRADIESHRRTRAERYIDDLMRRGTLNEQALLRFAFEERSMEFFLGLARYLNVDVQTMHRLLTDKTGQGLTIACRARGISPEGFKEIALSPMTGIAADVKEVLPLMRVYQRLSEANAQRAMRYWQTCKFVRRTVADRRSGLDTRSEEERARVGERRSGMDRRAAVGQRSSA
ncbi:MAG: DUF2336 domain-containing protein [Hyphomicrobiales bacterium]|nr:DUF2336 domain-containing protein [Hyphomicrobiales bacterium]